MRKKKSVIFIIITAAVIVFLTILYIISYREDKRLTPEVRAQIGGTFQKLSAGYTHYELIGPEDAPIVCLVHGSGPASFVWDRQIDALVKAGFRVLRYDRFGAGYSDRPHTKYNWDLFTTQLLELLDSLEIREPVHLVGRSLGARLVTCFTDQYPQRVHKLIVVSSALISPKISIFEHMRILPYIGVYLSRVLGKQLVKLQINTYKKYVHDQDSIKHYRHLILDQMRYKGTERAFRSLMKGNTIFDCPDVFQRVARKKSTVAFIWGDDDLIVPNTRIESYMEQYPHYSYYNIENAGHGINFTHPHQFNKALLSFLKDSEI